MAAAPARAALEEAIGELLAPAEGAPCAPGLREVCEHRATALRYQASLRGAAARDLAAALQQRYPKAAAVADLARAVPLVRARQRRMVACAAAAPPARSGAGPGPSPRGGHAGGDHAPRMGGAPPGRVEPAPVLVPLTQVEPEAAAVQGSEERRGDPAHELVPATEADPMDPAGQGPGEPGAEAAGTAPARGTPVHAGPAAGALSSPAYAQVRQDAAGKFRAASTATCREALCRPWGAARWVVVRLKVGTGARAGGGTGARAGGGTRTGAAGAMARGRDRTRAAAPRERDRQAGSLL